MNTKKNLSEYTDDELRTTQKQTKTIVMTLGSFMLIVFIFLIYSAIKTKNYALIAVGCGTSIAFMPLMTRFSMINKEFKSRKNNSKNL